MRIAVRIEEVDVELRRVTAVDKSGGRILLDYPFAQITSAIPAPGEGWMVYRDGYSWYLAERLDSQDDGRVKLNELNPGDVRVRAAKTVHIDADSVKINKVAIGPTRWDKFTIVDQETVMLTREPLSIDSIQAYNNGSLLDPTTIIIDGKELTFDPAPEAGPLIVYYQYHPEL